MGCIVKVLFWRAKGSQLPVMASCWLVHLKRSGAVVLWTLLSLLKLVCKYQADAEQINSGPWANPWRSQYLGISMDGCPPGRCCNRESASLLPTAASKAVKSRTRWTSCDAFTDRWIKYLKVKVKQHFVLIRTSTLTQHGDTDSCIHPQNWLL